MSREANRAKPAIALTCVREKFGRVAAFLTRSFSPALFGSLTQQLPFAPLNDFSDAQMPFTEDQFGILLKPLANLLFGGDGGTVVASAEVPADFAVRRRRVLACQVHGQHARMADHPRPLL